jgi:hypothetical protein
MVSARCGSRGRYRETRVGVAGLAVGTGVVLQKGFAERKKPQEGDEMIGVGAGAVCVSNILPRGRKAWRAFCLICYLRNSRPVK